MPSSLTIPLLLAGMILTVRLPVSCCAPLTIFPGLQQFALEQMAGYAMRRELRRP